VANGADDPPPRVPAGWHTVTPRIVARDAARLVDFLKQVFRATGEYRADSPAVVRIGDSVVMVSDAGARPPTPAFLYVYVGDVDATHRRALDAGARSIEEPAAMPYGDRRSMVEDGWGNVWQIATPASGGAKG
jgi:PhnB protein